MATILAKAKTSGKRTLQTPSDEWWKLTLFGPGGEVFRDPSQVFLP